MRKLFITAAFSLLIAVTTAPALTLSESKSIKYKNNAARHALKAACRQADRESKSVFMISGFPQCPACLVFEKFNRRPDVEPILRKYFILVQIDTNYMPDGKATFSKYAPYAGAPSWVILSPEKKVIADSFPRTEVEPGVFAHRNIGIPMTPSGRAHYRAALKKAAPAITEAELEALSKVLKDMDDARKAANGK